MTIVTKREATIPDSIKKSEQIEKVLERSRVIFHLKEGKPSVAFGQTAGGWGRVDRSMDLALRHFNEDEMRKLRDMKLDL